MQVCEIHIQYPLSSVCCLAACDFKNKSPGIAFVCKPQFSLWVTRRCRVKKYSSLYQVAVQVCHHARHMALTKRPFFFLVFLHDMIKIFLYAPGVMIIVSVVDGVDRSFGRTMNIRMTQIIFTYRWIECKAINATTGCINKHG